MKVNFHLLVLVVRSEGGRIETKGRIVLTAKPISVTEHNVPHNGYPIRKLVMWVTWVQFDTYQPQLVYNDISTVPVCTKWVELIHNVPSTPVQREYCWLRSFFPISSVFPPYVSADWAENNRTWSWNWWSDLRIVMSDPCPWTRTRPPCPTGRGSSCPSWWGRSR